MPDSLKIKTIRALSWSLFESIGVQGVQFVIGIVLARMLNPAQFGQIAMLSIFMAVAQTFLDGGFGAALIQKREVTQSDTSSIFYFNIVVGLAAASVLCLIAPWIATFYNQPVLAPLMRAMSLVIVINSFALINSTILQKQIDFKKLTKISLIASVLSGIIGIILAVNSLGVWSLVVQQISSTFFRCVLLWYFNTWRPALIFSFKSLREMFSFGSRLLASGLLDQIFANIYLLFIGKMFSATDLGLYSRAENLGRLPSQTLSGMVGRVTFPLFSTIQDDPTRLKRGMKRALTTLVLVNFPMMVGLAVTARPLVLVLLTEKWAESIPYLQLYCLAMLLFPLHVINLNLLQALGRSDLFLRLEIIKKVLVAVNIAVTWRWGISAMICGMIAMSVIAYFLNSYYAGILIGYPIQEQLRDLLIYMIMAALMGIGLYGVGLLPFPNHWSELLVQILVGIVLYGGLCRLFRLEAFMDIWRMSFNKMLFLRAGTGG